MAKKPAQPPQGQQQPEKKNSAVMALLLTGFIGAAFVYRPALVMVLMAGLIPTFAAWLTDAHKLRDLRVRIIFAFNVAGVLPYADEVGSGDSGFNQAIELVTSLETYMVIYSFAAMGSFVVFIAPYVAAFFLQIMANSRIAVINSQQKALLDKWGNQLKGEKEEDGKK